MGTRNSSRSCRSLAARFSTGSSTRRRRGGLLAKHFARKLAIESLEGRMLLSADLRVRFEYVDAAQTPVASLQAGHDYTLRAYVEDMRSAATGVKQAYFNLSYDSTLATFNNPVTAGDDYNLLPSGSASAGLIADVGGEDTDLLPPNPANTELRLFSMPVHAFQSGNLVLTPTLVTDDPFQTVLFFGNFVGTTLDDIDFVGQSITVTGTDVTPPTADIVDVTPDPRNTAVGLVTVNFSENVSGVDVNDFSLTRNGTPVSLSGLTVTQVNASQYTLDLSTKTGSDGTYVLKLTAAGSGITDGAGNALAADASDTWLTDATPPTADIVDVTPDPRNTAVGLVTVNFSENVSGVDVNDFSLTRNGTPVSLSGLTVTQVNASQYTLDLSTKTGSDGTYVLKLTAAGSGITDTVGNALTADASDTWVTDATPPTADIVDVTPDPRNTAVGLVTVNFSENVSGVDVNDFSLTRNGTPVSLAGLTVTQVTASQYTLDLSTKTGSDGTYVLKLTAAGSGITDTVGNALTADASDTWVTDATPPTADIVDVTPDPRSTAVGLVTVNFSENVSGVDVNDFSLTRNGTPVSLAGLTVTQVTASQYTLDLSTKTGSDGTYVLKLTAAGSGITDTVGNGFAADASDTWLTNATAPTADIVDVTPDPRNTAVGLVTVNFSENVSGVDVNDFSLTRNGTAVSLAGLTVTQATASQYTLDLFTKTGSDGTYVLTLTAAGSGIVDSVGNGLAADASDTWVMETTAGASSGPDGPGRPHRRRHDVLLYRYLHGRRADPGSDTGRFRSAGDRPKRFQSTRQLRERRCQLGRIAAGGDVQNQCPGRNVERSNRQRTLHDHDAGRSSYGYRRTSGGRGQAGNVRGESDAGRDRAAAGERNARVAGGGRRELHVYGHLRSTTSRSIFRDWATETSA